jgi:hypothetical protein
MTTEKESCPAGRYSVDGVGSDELELKLTGGHKAHQVGRHTILTL